MKIFAKGGPEIKIDDVKTGSEPQIFEITSGVPDGAIQREREAYRLSVSLLSQLMGNVRVPILLSGNLDFFELKVYLETDLQYSDHQIETLINSMTRLLTVDKLNESDVKNMVLEYFESNPLPSSSTVIANTDDTTGGVNPAEVVNFEAETRRVVSEITKAYERSITRGFGDALVAANTTMGTPESEANLAAVRIRKDLASALASVQKVYISLYNRQPIADVLSTFAKDVNNNPLMSFMTRMLHIAGSTMSALTEVRMANVVNQFIDHEIISERFKLIISRFGDDVKGDQSDFMFKISGDPTVQTLTYKAVLSRYLEFFTSIMKGEALTNDSEPVRIDAVVEALTNSVISGNDYTFAMTWIKSALSSVRTEVDKSTIKALDDISDLIVLMRTFNSVVGGHPSSRKSVFGEAFNKAYSPIQTEQNKGRVDEVCSVCGLILDAVSDSFSFLHDVVTSTKSFDDVNSDVQTRVREALDNMMNVFTSSSNNPVSVVYHPSHFLTTENALNTLSVGGQMPELVPYLPDSAVKNAKTTVVFDSYQHALRKITIFANNKWDLIQSDQTGLYEIMTLLRGNVNKVPTLGHYYKIKVNSPFALDEKLLRAARAIPYSKFIERNVAGALEGEYEIVTLTSVESIMNFFQIPYDVISTTKGDYAPLFKKFLDVSEIQMFAFPKTAYDNYIFFTNSLKGIENVRYAYEFQTVNGLTLSRYLNKIQSVGYVVLESVEIARINVTPTKHQTGVLQTLLGLTRVGKSSKRAKKGTELNPGEESDIIETDDDANK